MNISQNLSTSSSTPLPSISDNTSDSARSTVSFKDILNQHHVDTASSKKGFRVIVILETAVQDAENSGALNTEQANQFLDQLQECHRHHRHQHIKKPPINQIEKELKELIAALTELGTTPDTNTACSTVLDPATTSDQEAGIAELKQKLTVSQNLISPETKQLGQDTLALLNNLLEMLNQLKQSLQSPISNSSTIEAPQSDIEIVKTDTSKTASEDPVSSPTPQANLNDINSAPEETVAK
jgi:chaperonin cofactor prefoldin